MPSNQTDSHTMLAPSPSEEADTLSHQIAIAQVPSTPPGLESRVADLEATNAQLVAAISELVDNIVQLRNEDVHALDQRTQAQAKQIKELQKR